MENRTSKSFVPLYRSLQAHWLWQEKPFSKGQAWIDLLMSANHTDKKQMLRGKVVTCKRGDVNLSMLELSKKWGWDRSKVKRFLETLEADGMVTVNATTQRTTITIENYSTYNYQSATTATTEPTTDTATDAQQTQQRTHITKKEKKEKNEKKEKKSIESVLSLAPPEMVPALQDFVEMRKAIKAPMTPRALELLISKLNTLSGQSTQTSIAILHQSIENGWKGVYELKGQQVRKDDVAAAFMRGDF